MMPVMHDRSERPLPPPDFQALFEAAPGLFLVLRPDLVIVAASDAYLRATMTRREAIVGRHLFEVFPDNPSDPEATGVSNLRQSLERVLTTHLPDTMAFQKYDIRRPESEGGGFEERYWSPLNSPVLNPDGSLALIIHRVEDVTEFVRLSRVEAERNRVADELQTRLADSDAELLTRAAETALVNRELARVNSELRRSQDFLDSLVENIPDMIFVKDAVDFRYVRFNRAGEELIGWSREDLLGRTDYDLFPREEADRYRENDLDVITGKRAVDITEEPVETRHGQRILHTKKIPVFNEQGTPMYLLGISEDVTARKETQDAMEAARVALEAASAAKSDFLSRMSHELRTPLTAILGFSELLGFEELTEPQRANLRHITAAGQHLLALINEVLDISRIESGMMSLSIEPVGVREVLEELVILLGPQAGGRHVTIEIVGGHVGTHVVADRQRLKQVLLNLLTNAIKYNRVGGSIRIGCRPVDDRLRIEVVDSGYGLAPEQTERLFRPFERLGAEVGSIEGTGIGLALSKGLIEAMGGRIGVESQLDVGSTFWVELATSPAPTAAAASEDPQIGPTAPDGPDRTVLYIEDNHANQRLVQQILARRPSITLLVASDGTRGLELARDERPALILLDLHLPDMPGREVLRLLRTNAETRHIPVLIVSADASIGQAERLTEAGAIGYLTKPLVVSQFLAEVDGVLARPASA
jgi:PAS domain S-box-containing protein